MTPESARNIDLRHALRVTSAWLVAIVREFKLDESRTRAVVRQDGELIAELSIAQALDLANEALEPEHAGKTP